MSLEEDLARVGRQAVLKRQHAAEKLRLQADLSDESASSEDQLNCRLVVMVSSNTLRRIADRLEAGGGFGCGSVSEIVRDALGQFFDQFSCNPSLRRPDLRPR